LEWLSEKRARIERLLVPWSQLQNPLHHVKYMRERWMCYQSALWINTCQPIRTALDRYPFPGPGQVSVEFPGAKMKSQVSAFCGHCRFPEYATEPFHDLPFNLAIGKSRVEK
jgi:hypothetical protein